MLLRSTLLLCASVLALPTAAAAQDRAADEQEVTTVGEIIVTAQRRSERLTDVPISITAISAEMLENQGVSTTTDLGLVTPGLYMAQNGQSVQPTIRGIGTSITSAGADANVALYLDGVYQPNQAANVFDLPDVEQIEVLKGPQGTLFGRNATGGAIRITTRDPYFTPGGSFNASYGRFNEVRLSGAVNLPLGDQFAVGLTAQSVNDDGYVYNNATGNMLGGTDQLSLRGKLLFQPDEDLRFILTGYYSDRSDSAVQAVAPLNRNVVSLQTTPNLFIPSARNVVSLDADPGDTVVAKGVSLRVRWDRPYGSFSSITSLDSFDPSIIFDTDYTSLPSSLQLFGFPEDVFSQELSFASDFDGPFNFVAGAFYFDDSVHRTQRSVRGLGGTLISALEAFVDTTASAVFAEVYVDVTDRFRLIGGLRYSQEEKSIRAGGAVGGPYTHNDSKSWDSVTPRVSAIYELNDDANLYATFSQGFKSGAYNTSFSAGLPVQTPPIDPEEVTAYEVGYKLGNANVRFNASAYYYDYQDIQVQILTSINGANTTILQNAATATIYGVDVDLSTDLSERWTLDAGLAYTHGRYDDFTGAILTFPRVGGGNTQGPGDASGNEMIRTPEWSGNIGLSYTHPLGPNEIVASVNASYNGGFFWDVGNRVSLDPYTILSSRVAYVFHDGAYRVSLWGNNLLDEHYQIYSAQSTTGDNVAYGRPRTYGISLSMKFN